jgi:hypothetical protein
MAGFSVNLQILITYRAGTSRVIRQLASVQAPARRLLRFVALEPAGLLVLVPQPGLTTYMQLTLVGFLLN